MSVSSSRSAAALCFAAGVSLVPVPARAADDVATVAFNNRSWSNPTAWTHSNPAANGTVPNNGSLTYDVVVGRPIQLDLNVTVSKGTLANGEISSTAADNALILRFDDVFEHQGGTLGVPTVAAGGLRYTGGISSSLIDGITVDNLARADWTGGNILPILGGGIVNGPQGVFWANDPDSDQVYDSLDLTGWFDNHGTFRKLGTHTTTFRATVNNTGAMHFDDGLTRFTHGGSTTGLFDLAAPAKITFTSSTYVFRDGARVTGLGWTEVGQSGNLRIGEDAQPPAKVTIQNLYLNRGGLFMRGGTSILHLTGESEFDRGQVDGPGTIKLPSGAKLGFTLASGPMAINRTVIENEGETTVVGGGSNSLALQNEAWFRNGPGGVLNLNAPAAIVTTTPAAHGGVINHGTMRVNATPQGNRVDLFDVDFENQGDVTVGIGGFFGMINTDFTQLDGSLNVDRDAAVLLFNAFVNVVGGQLTGVGEVRSDVQVGTQPGSTARVSPGPPDSRRGATTGKLTIQGALTTGDNAELFIELGGRTPTTQYDLLDVIGTAALDGDLLVDLIDGFEGSILASDVFTVLTTDAPLTGAFDNVANGGRVTGVDGISTFKVNYGPGSPFDPNALVLSDFLAIPEPGTGVTTCVIAALLMRRSRRRLGR